MKQTDSSNFSRSNLYFGLFYRVSFSAIVRWRTNQARGKISLLLRCSFPGWSLVVIFVLYVGICRTIPDVKPRDHTITVQIVKMKQIVRVWEVLVKGPFNRQVIGAWELLIGLNGKWVERDSHGIINQSTCVLLGSWQDTLLNYSFSSILPLCVRGSWVL